MSASGVNPFNLLLIIEARKVKALGSTSTFRFLRLASLSLSLSLSPLTALITDHAKAKRRPLGRFYTCSAIGVRPNLYAGLPYRRILGRHSLKEALLLVSITRFQIKRCLYTHFLLAILRFLDPRALLYHVRGQRRYQQQRPTCNAPVLAATLPNALYGVVVRHYLRAG